MQILKKIQLYDIMFKKSNRLGISMDDLSDIVEKKEICNEKRIIFWPKLIKVELCRIKRRG